MKLSNYIFYNCLFAAFPVLIVHGRFNYLLPLLQPFGIRHEVVDDLF